MKKLPALLLLILIGFLPSCKKSNATQDATSAHLKYGGNPAADGTGYYLQIDATKENIYAINLPSSFRDPGGANSDMPVAIKFVDTGKRQIPGYGVAPGWRIVYLVSIERP